MIPLAISVLGATGKMGKCILSAALRDPQMCVVSATGRPDSALLGIDVATLVDLPSAGVYLQADVIQALTPAAVALDFSVREAALSHIHAAKEAKKPLIIGTTGLGNEAIRAIELAAQDIPIIHSANFSLGIALCTEAVQMLARTLRSRFAINIFETHHVHKKDSPSGTALALARAMDVDNSAAPIAIHAVRAGETIGEHLVVFEDGEERIELKHTAHSRGAFAQGALLAAKLLFSKPAGLYSFKDLLQHE